MSKYLDDIKKIIYPYLMKKEELNYSLNRLQDISNNLALEYEEFKTNKNIEINKLNTKLEKLIDNREKEIAEYLEQLYLTNTGASHIYASMVKKDLEKLYKRQEIVIENEINKLKQEIKEAEKMLLHKLHTLTTIPNYSRVYEKELTEIIPIIKEALLEKIKELNLAYQEEKSLLSFLTLDIVKFKFLYDENYKLLNLKEWDELNKKEQNLKIDLSDIEIARKVVEEYLNSYDFNRELTFITLTPFEQDEYDRRKAKELEDLKEEPKKSK